MHAVESGYPERRGVGRVLAVCWHLVCARRSVKILVRVDNFLARSY